MLLVAVSVQLSMEECVGFWVRVHFYISGLSFLSDDFQTARFSCFGTLVCPDILVSFVGIISGV